MTSSLPPHVLLILVSGPILLIQRARRASTGETPASVRRFTAAMVATTWSFCTGLALLNLSVAISG